MDLAVVDQTAVVLNKVKAIVIVTAIVKKK